MVDPIQLDISSNLNTLIADLSSFSVSNITRILRLNKRSFEGDEGQLRARLLETVLDSEAIFVLQLDYLSYFFHGYDGSQLRQRINSLSLPSLLLLSSRYRLQTDCPELIRDDLYHLTSRWLLRKDSQPSVISKITSITSPCKITTPSSHFKPIPLLSPCSQIRASPPPPPIPEPTIESPPIVLPSFIASPSRIKVVSTLKLAKERESISYIPSSPSAETSSKVKEIVKPSSPKSIAPKKTTIKKPRVTKKK